MPRAPATTWKRRLVLGLMLILVAAGVWSLFEFVIWNKIPAELVGKWEIMEGPDEGGTVDFFRNGNMVAHVNSAGKLGIIEAKIRVEERKIHVTTRHRQTGEEGTRVQSIKSLEGDRLVLQDERGILLKLRRTE
jgi:hypothetical protein